MGSHFPEASGRMHFLRLSLSFVALEIPSHSGALIISDFRFEPQIHEMQKPFFFESSVVGPFPRDLVRGWSCQEGGGVVAACDCDLNREGARSKSLQNEGYQLF